MTTDPISYDLVTSWVPRALALCAVAGGALAFGMSPRQRLFYLAQYVALYAFVPILLVAYAQGPIPEMDGWHRDPKYVHLGLAYMLLVAGVAVHLASGVWRLLPRHDDRAIAVALGAVALVVYLAVFPYQPAVRDLVADEPHYLVFTQSLWLDQDLDLTNDYARDPYQDFWPSRLPDVHAVAADHGLFPLREPGLPLLLVIPFGIEGRYGALHALVVVGAALVVQLYLLLRDLQIDRRIALATVLLLAFTHPLISYTTQIFPELAVALALVTAARILRRGRDAPAMAFAIASAISGVLLWLTARTLPLVFVIVVCGLLWAACPGHATTRARIALRVAAAIVPFALAFLALAALNGYFFGDPLPSAGARLFYVSKPFVTTPTMTPQIGATGLFVDRIFGLFRNAPEYMLGLIGVIPLLGALRRRSPIAILLTAVFTLYVFALSMYFYWHADWTPAPRYLVSLVPFLAVVTALGVQRVLVTRVGALVTVLLAAYSAAITYLFLAHPSLMYNWGTHEEATRWTSGALGLFLQRWIGFDPGVVYPSLWWLDGATLPLSLAWCAFAALLILAGRSGPRPVVARAPTPEPVPETS